MSRRCAKTRPLVAAGALLLASAGAAQQDRFAGVEIKTVPVAGPVYMIEGAGGNIGVSAGADGVLMVDSQFAPLAKRILAAVKAIGGGAPKLLLNTHLHGDHVGGNAFFAATGVVLAHTNVRARMATQSSLAGSVGNAAASGLPTATFDDRLRLFFNGDEIDVIHLPRGHTDGDAVVWFKDSQVIHMGDHLFSKRFPFVDVANGGTVAGLLRNLEQVLEMLPPDTKVIPGHGPLGGVPDIVATAEMIRRSVAAVRKAAAAGKVEELKQSGIDGYQDWNWGFVNAARWIDTIVASEAALASDEAVAPTQE